MRLMTSRQSSRSSSSVPFQSQMTWRWWSPIMRSTLAGPWQDGRVRATAVCLLASAVIFCPRPAAAAPTAIALFDDAAAAVTPLLPGRAIVAFGEFHEIAGQGQATSALAHFRDELLAALLPAMSDLVVETWATTGRCGGAETRAVTEVQETIKRPESTESEIVGVLRRAKAGGARPHVLEIDCHEYESLTDRTTGKVDYVRLLTIVTEALRRTTLAALGTPGPAPPKKAVVVYGGALHNDVFPRKELAAFSFARDLGKRTRGRYLEIDLYVPEYIERDEWITKQPWYPRYVAAARPGKVTRVRRSGDSYIVVFPRASAVEAGAL